MDTSAQNLVVDLAAIPAHGPEIFTPPHEITNQEDHVWNTSGVELPNEQSDRFYELEYKPNAKKKKFVARYRLKVFRERLNDGTNQLRYSIKIHACIFRQDRKNKPEVWASVGKSANEGVGNFYLETELLVQDDSAIHESPSPGSLKFTGPNLEFTETTVRSDHHKRIVGLEEKMFVLLCEKAREYGVHTVKVINNRDLRGQLPGWLKRIGIRRDINRNLIYTIPHGPLPVWPKPTTLSASSLQPSEEPPETEKSFEPTTAPAASSDVPMETSSRDYGEERYRGIARLLNEDYWLSLVTFGDRDGYWGMRR